MDLKEAKIDHQKDKEMAFKEKLTSLKSGSFNDVRIVLQDGEIEANKINLCLHSDYFQEVFQNNFSSGEINVDSKKYFMDKMLEYLFEGKIDLINFQFVELFELLKLSKTMKLWPLFKEIQNFAFNSTANMKVDESLEALVYVFRNDLLGDVDFLLDHLDTPQNLELARENDVFKYFPLDLVEKLLMRKAPTIDRLNALHVWNQAWREERMNQGYDAPSFAPGLKEIIESFHREDFTAEDLVGIVNLSGFYSNGEIMMMLGKVVADKTTEVATLQETIVEKEKVIEGLQESVDTLTKNLELLTARVINMEEKFI